MALLVGGSTVSLVVNSLPMATAGRGVGASVSADIAIYGGTSAGVAAAMQARRMGKSVVIVEPGHHLGGMTSGGLGQTDVGDRAAIGGISREFYAAALEHYVRTYGGDSQQVKDSHDGFRFEPHVAEGVFRSWVPEEGIAVYFGEYLAGVDVSGRRITAFRCESGLTVSARVFIDATYEGDLMAAAGVSYTVGREAAAKYRERYNGVQFGQPHHNFRTPVDPYVIGGDPSSGLLPGISTADPGRQGDRDTRVQAYNFRMCLTNVPENRISFPKPDGYDPMRYELLARYIRSGVFDCLNNTVPMPNGKTDTNNHGGFSTDNIGMSYDYPEGDRATRERIIEEHRTYQIGLMWFLCNDERVPSEIRGKVSQWGLCRDEFVDSDGWPHQMYIRESRRMVSDYVVTEHNCMGRKGVDDSVGLASYGMDSHNTQRIVRDGRALNEGDVEIGVPQPYGIPYRSIVPRRGECGNLLVPVCLSASHIAYGSVRMEPVFMVLGQSAATAAALAIDAGVSVQAVDVARLQRRLVADGQILEWDPALGGGTRAPMIDPKSLPGIVLDDADAEPTGEWLASTIAQNRRVGTGYVHDGNTGKGDKTLVFRPRVERSGRYRVILIAPPNENRATNAPISVQVGGREVLARRVDLRDAASDGFVAIGEVELPAGTTSTIVLGNADTNGYVVADGLQLLEAE